VISLTDKLKPCPFCGYDMAQLKKKMVTKKGEYRYSVVCGKCCMGSGDYRYENGARRMWNTRAYPETGGENT
jgi:hypothetical protein